MATASETNADLRKQLTKLRNEYNSLQYKYDNLLREVQSEEHAFRINLRTQLLDALSYQPPSRYY